MSPVPPPPSPGRIPSLGGSGGAEFFLAQKGSARRGGGETAQALNHRARGLPEGKGPLPLSWLSPSPSAAFTVVAIKCQLLGVRNNKHCNSAQSKHPLSV